MRKWASTRAFRTLNSHTMLLRTLFVAAALLVSPQALPGKATTPQALGITLTLRGDEARKLVLIKEASASQVSLFRSNGGRTHLKFRIEAEGQTYEAIMYQGEWNAADRERLAAGPVDLVGVWGTFANQPSLTVKRVLTQSPQAAPATAAKKPLLKIEAAQINVGSLQKFRSAAQKVHVTYTFTVNGKTYQGVLYAGSWSTPTLDLLRSGRATLYGWWSTYADKPSFVTEKVER